MIFRILIAAAFFSILSKTVLASECRLSVPIPISQDPLKQHIVLHNVKSDLDPIFITQANYNSSIDSLELNLFNIEWGKGLHSVSPTGFIGASLEVKGKNEVIGFANTYIGIFKGLTGEIVAENGVTTYHSFAIESQIDSSYRGSVKPISELTLKTSQNFIVSVELTYPVYTEFQRVESYRSVHYQGENRKLCILSAN